jgi:hypothetical protein
MGALRIPQKSPKRFESLLVKFEPCRLCAPCQAAYDYYPVLLLIGRRDQIGFVSQYGAIVILGLFLQLSFFQAHPRASAIFIDEFDASGLQS